MMGERTVAQEALFSDVENAAIMDVEATTAVLQAEVTAAKTRIERPADRFGVWPEKLIGDTGYGSAERLAWRVEEKAIEPHFPVFDKSRRKDGTFSRSDFSFDIEADAWLTSRRARKKVERLFAHLKRLLKLDRLRLRGPHGARDVFLLAATAQNLRTLAKPIPMPAPATAG